MSLPPLISLLVSLSLSLPPLLPFPPFLLPLMSLLLPFFMVPSLFIPSADCIHHSIPPSASLPFSLLLFVLHSLPPILCLHPFTYILLPLHSLVPHLHPTLLLHSHLNIISHLNVIFESVMHQALTVICFRCCYDKCNINRVTVKLYISVSNSVWNSETYMIAANYVGEKHIFV